MIRVISLFSALNDKSEHETDELFLFPYMNTGDFPGAYGGSYYLPIIMRKVPDLY